MDVMSQKRLLEIILASRATLPLDFLIFSRPEPHITRCFRRENLVPAPRIMDLGSDFAVLNDIERYLRTEFDSLREEHRSTLPISWPGDHVIVVLVRRSTGQFIYVTIVIKYLRTGKFSFTAERRLQIVLSTEPVSNSTSPYPDLDQLYSQILQSCTNDGRTLQRVLKLIISPVDPVDLGIAETPFKPLRSPPTRMVSATSAIVVEQLLDLNQGDATALLSGLHSILHVPEDRTESVSVIHASFTDFLLDPRRSGDYHVGQRLRSKGWKEMILHYQVKWLSRLGSRYGCARLSLHGAEDHEFGSLNLWKYHYNKLYEDRVAMNEEIMNEGIIGALEGFDPHQYLAMVMHWYVATGAPFLTSGMLSPHT